MNQVPSPIDFAALLEMLGGEKQIVASLLSKFVEELSSDLAASEQAVVDHDASLMTIKQQVMSDQARLVQEAIESWRAEN